jgi:serine/threonine protein kinase
MMSPALEIGEYLGDAYLVCGALGRRGIHRLYEAEDLVLARRVAIEIATDATALRREAKALAAVPHPGMPAVYGLGWHRGLGYLALERLDGVTLAELIERRRHAADWFHVREILPWLTALADALAAVHQAGMAHGALATGGLVVCGEGRVVLADFAAAAAGPAAAPLDSRAFGRIAHELFIGAPPGGPDDDLAAIRPDVPIPLADLVRACLAEAGDPPAMAEVVEHLRALPRRRTLGAPGRGRHTGRARPGLTGGTNAA